MSPADRRSAISQRRHTGLGHPAPTLRLHSIEQPRNGIDMHTDVSPPPPRATALSSEQLAARELGRTRRAALRRRARRIRRGVAGLAAVTFSAAFLAIYVELASGHDPALSTKQATASPSAQNASTKSNGSSSGGGSGSASAGSSSSGETSTGSTGSSGESTTGSGGESSGGASAVRTSQS